MEDTKKANFVDIEEEYVMLDLDSVCVQTDIPANAPFDLSGLDTQNPILVINNKLKLIGEYEETIGTCFIFSESDSTPGLHNQAGVSETDLFTGKCTMDSNQVPTRQVKPIARLTKVLKFRPLISEEDATEKM